MSKTVAHARLENEDFEIHDLDKHLFDVAARAREFANVFSSGEWAFVAGLWHDLGKYRPAFQAYIKRGSGLDPNAHVTGEHNPKTAHASVGAVHAVRCFDMAGRIPAYLIAGHHAGLPDWNESGDAAGRGLAKTLEQDIPLLDEALAAAVPEQIREIAKPTSMHVKTPEALHLWMRMLFSCLVDADFLDTEAFMQPEKVGVRGASVPMKTLLDAFNRYMEQFNVADPKRPYDTNSIRAEVLELSRTAASATPGVFTMTVPTGGGKTLSSLAFALEHAVQHGKRRVIYAIPYTSIIEQTAGIFSQIFEELGDVLVEHHSNTEPKESKQENTWSRISAENWDAPVIVTTTVQLFESLFAARTSRCRKLHNLANSVIVLDETQLLPARLLAPIRSVIGQLAEYYGVTFLLTTATPTGLGAINDPFGRELLGGIPSTEVIPHPERYYRALNRVTFNLPDDFTVQTRWDDLAAAISDQNQVLAVVNKRDDARTLFELLPQDEGVFHLSALMCAEHRSDVIEEIKQRLTANEKTQVISTQLVEAGVDFDFPVVYRALAGLDSIVQAAGRCNREGRLDKGQVHVFVPESTMPPGFMQIAAHTTISVLHGHKHDIATPLMFKRYFNSLFTQIDTDQPKVLEPLTSDAATMQIQFRTAAQRFRMIDDQNTITVFVRYGGEDSQVDSLLYRLAEKPENWVLRKLQRHTVTLYQNQFYDMLARGELEEIGEGFYAQSGSGVYDEQLGLRVKETIFTPHSSVQ